MESKTSVLIGIVTGGIAKMVWGDLGIAILTAMCTGSASYIGYHIAKAIHKKAKEIKNKIKR